MWPLRPLNRPIHDWRGCRVWIVGASSGIGEALARELAAHGAVLALSARGAERLGAVAQACGALALPMDVTRNEDILRCRDALLAAWGGFDLVVLNAGTYTPLRAWELNPQNVRDTLAPNLLGIYDAVSALVPQLVAQGRGALALVGSVAAYCGLPKASVYGPSKAALAQLAECLYLDLAPRGVGVFLVSPGFVATPLTAGNDFHMPALMQPDAAARAMLDGFAAGRFEIHFPRRFSLAMKCLGMLPHRVRFGLLRRIA